MEIKIIVHEVVLDFLSPVEFVIFRFVRVGFCILNRDDLPCLMKDMEFSVGSGLGRTFYALKEVAKEIKIVLEIIWRAER